MNKWYLLKQQTEKGKKLHKLLEQQIEKKENLHKLTLFAFRIYFMMCLKDERILH